MMKIKKEAILNNPESFKLNKFSPFTSPIYVESCKSIILNAVDTDISSQCSTDSLDSLKSFLDGTTIEILHIDSDLVIDFSNEYLTLNNFKLNLTKTSNPALISLLKVLKIPYSSFYKTNKTEFNKNLLIASLSRSNFKESKLGYKITLLVSGNEIRYAYSFDELQYIDFEKINSRSILSNLESSEKIRHIYTIESSSGVYKHNIVSTSDTKVNIDGILYSTGSLLSIDIFTNKHFIRNIYYNEINETFIIAKHSSFSIQSFKDKMEYSLNNEKSTVATILLINSLDKFSLSKSLIRDAISQQLELGGFRTIGEFINILAIFIKQYKIEKYIDQASALESFITCLYDYFNSNKDIITETFSV